MVELFFPVGQDRGLRPGDFVGALANECNMPGHVIGRVTLLERKTFVAVPPDVARHVLNTIRTLWLKGDDVPVAMARPPGFPHPGGPGGDRPSFGGDRPGFGGDRPGGPKRPGFGRPFQKRS
jgi:ATP-dependent RNA helicase DeaD